MPTIDLTPEQAALLCEALRENVTAKAVAGDMEIPDFRKLVDDTIELVKKLESVTP